MTYFNHNPYRMIGGTCVYSCDLEDQINPGETSQRDAEDTGKWVMELLESPNGFHNSWRGYKWSYEADAYLWGYSRLAFAEFWHSHYRINRARYLSTDHWFNIRAWAREIGNRHCWRCGKPAPTELHHRCYLHLGQERPSCLVFLCRNCHRGTHEETKIHFRG